MHSPLKKGRAPREVVAQLLEYAAWVDELSDEAIYQLAENYFLKNPDLHGKQLNDLFFETFELDEMPIPSSLIFTCRLAIITAP